MANKITKKDRYAQLRVLVEANGGDEELLDFIDHEVELLTNKNSKKTPTKTQKENEDIKKNILDILGNSDHPLTVADIMGQLSGDFTNQKISAILTLLKKDGAVVRTEDKKKAYFALA